MNDYNEYVRIQTEVHGQIKKPRKYRVGERKAIDWFFRGVNKSVKILDIGCGLGYGILHLNSLGYYRTWGIELNGRKVEVCRRRGLNVWGNDFLMWDMKDRLKFDVFWISHSFEHMWKPKEVVQKLISLSNPNAKFFFVMPYPDTGDRNAHCASEEIGLRKDDDGNTVTGWFEKQGLELIYGRYDNFREREIWLQFKI